MKIKKGDNVIVVSGSSRGQTGTVERSIPKENKVVVSGVNKRKIHQKARVRGEKGSIIERNIPVNVSNVMIVDTKTNKPTRIGFSTSSDGKKMRVSKKSGTNI